MLSATYRQVSSAVDPDGGPSESQRRDPLNEWFSRMPLKRMEAELVRDTALWVADRLNDTPFGPPDPVNVRKDGLVTAKSVRGGWRRSVYLRQRRKEFPTFLSTFDLPSMTPNCIQRTESTVALQALFLMNSPVVKEHAVALATRMSKETDESGRLELLWMTLLNRPITDIERREAVEFLRKAGKQHGWAELCHALLASNAFLIRM